MAVHRRGVAKARQSAERRAEPIAEARSILKSWRLKNGYSLRDVGDAIGVSSVAVYEWERGTRNPSPRFQEALETVTNGAVAKAGWPAPKTLKVQPLIRHRRRTGTDD